MSFEQLSLFAPTVLERGWSGPEGVDWCIANEGRLVHLEDAVASLWPRTVVDVEGILKRRDYAIYSSQYGARTEWCVNAPDGETWGHVSVAFREEKTGATGRYQGSPRAAWVIE